MRIEDTARNMSAELIRPNLEDANARHLMSLLSDIAALLLLFESDICGHQEAHAGTRNGIESWKVTIMAASCNCAGCYYGYFVYLCRWMIVMSSSSKALNGCRWSSR